VKKKLHIGRDNTGATTIVVVCVMAIIMALSLGLFLTASVLLSTSGGTLALEQSRILAVSFSEEVERMLTDERYSFESRSGEEAGRAENINGQSLWHYVKQNINEGTWAYLEEGQGSLHSRENAVRSFQMEQSGAVGEVVGIDLSMYWTRQEDSDKPEKLVVKTTATIKDQSCTITDVYDLEITSLGDYEKWSWKHVEKK